MTITWGWYDDQDAYFLKLFERILCFDWKSFRSKYARPDFLLLLEDSGLNKLAILFIYIHTER